MILINNMKQLNQFIQEKLKINKDTKVNDFFKFDLDNFKEEIKLPIKLRLIDQQETELIYRIAKKEYKGKFYWQLFNEYDKLVVYLHEYNIIRFFKKEKISTIVHNLGKYAYSRSDTIKLVD